MRKALRIIAVSAGIVSLVSTVVLGFIYLEDVVKHVKKIKSKLSNKNADTNYIGDEFESE